MPPSIIRKQLFWAEPPPAGFSTNFVPDYLDQRALKDPGKDKHSVLGGMGGWRTGVCFQTEQKSPRNYLRTEDKRGEPFSRQSHHTRCLFSRRSEETLLICVASPDRSPKMISLNLSVCPFNHPHSNRLGS